MYKDMLRELKKFIMFLVLLGISGIAHSEVQIKPPEMLSKAISVSVVLEDNLKESIVIYDMGVWKNEDLIKARLLEVRSIIFRIPGNEMPHLVQVHKGNVIFVIHDRGPLSYEITIPVSEFIKKVFPKYKG
jgi:hypothetical protein